MEGSIVAVAELFLDGQAPAAVVIATSFDTDREKLPGAMSNVVLDLRYARPGSRQFANLVDDLLRLDSATRREQNERRAKDLAEEIEEMADEIEGLEKDIRDRRGEQAGKIMEWEDLTGEVYTG